MTPENSYLAPSRFIDSDAPNVRDFARKAVAGAKDETAQVIALYRAVRESVLYDPYVDMSLPSTYRASEVLAAGRGYCVSKAAVLAAVARARLCTACSSARSETFWLRTELWPVPNN